MRRPFSHSFSGDPRTVESYVWALALFAVVVLWPAESFAQTLGDIICNISKGGVLPFPSLFNGIAFVAAAFLAFQGALLFRKHAENPNDSQVVKAIAHMLVAGALVGLPYFAGTLQKTIFAKIATGGSSSCEVGKVTDVQSAAGLDVMLKSFVGNVRGPIFSLLTALSFAIGVYLIFRGLHKASKVGTDPRAAATHSIVVHWITGAVLISIAAMFKTMIQTIFGGTGELTDFSQIINWSGVITSDEATAANKAIEAILMFVQIIGGIAFVRGWLMIKNAVEGAGQVTVPQGLTHVIGGTMALNIGAMVQIFARTFGEGSIVNT